MKSLLTPFKVGLVVIAAVLAFAFMFVTVDDGLDTSQIYEVHAVFDDATGLAEKGRVQVAGIKVGEISRIELIPGEAKAKVFLQLQKRVVLKQGIAPPPAAKESLWTNGATLVKKQASLVGDYYLDLAPGTQGPQIPNEGQIKNTPVPPGFDQIISKFNDISDEITKVAKSLSEIIASEDGQSSIKNIFKQLDELITGINSFLKDNRRDFDSIVTNTKTTTQNVSALTNDARRDLKAVLTNAQVISRELRTIISQSGGDVQDGIGDFRNLLTRLSKTLDTLNYSLQNVSEITDKVNEGEGTLGALVNDPQIAEDTKAIVTEVRDFVDDAAGLKTIVELRSEYLFRQSALKNYVSFRLQPNPNKYYLLEIVDDPRGRTNTLQTTTVQTDPSQPPIVREEQLITTDDFKVSVQLARRWNFFTARFGLIESSGGVGGDLHFLNDNFEIRMDLFDFGEDVNPRLRTAFAYSFIDYVYFSLGTDDILNDQTRDFYIGATLRFNDENLKTIFAIGPSVNP